MEHVNLEYWLPLFFVSIMGFALLVYIILDGYDLGIGMLLPFASDEEKDQMVAAIGPFWDANETWIVLGVGVLLIAFPQAHGIILTSLYLPVTIMLMGLILRGVAFDFRVKAKTDHKNMWNVLFALGSLVTAMSQGWMLGQYVMGLQTNGISLLFSLAIACTLPAMYVMLGCGWLLIKGSVHVQQNALRWASITFWPMGLGLFLVSIATPVASAAIADRWFTLPAAIGLLPIPLTTLIAFFALRWLLKHGHAVRTGYEWTVFAALIVICVMCAIGLAYSIYPDVIIDRLDIWKTAASTASLKFTFVGVVIAVPMITIYTLYIYKLFSGKSTALSYE